MLTKSQAKSTLYKAGNPRQLKDLEIEEKCALCHRELVDGALILRNTETKQILCLICLVDIAEIND